MKNIFRSKLTDEQLKSLLVIWKKLQFHYSLEQMTANSLLKHHESNQNIF